MRNLYVLAAALEQVEERLGEPIRLEELARDCFSSPSALQKLFRYVFCSSVSEYVARRRLSKASEELVGSDRGILDIALDYQYGSAEAFSRAFKRFWGISPSQFRRERRFTGLYPRFTLDYADGGYIMPTKRRVDISELYDVLRGMPDTYVLGVDVAGLHPVNQAYGHNAGDLVIAEVAARIEQEIGDDMLMFRVGGDEFAVVTGYRTAEETRGLQDRIAGHNGKTVAFEGTEIPVSARFGACRIPQGNIRYNELYDRIARSLGYA